MTRLAGKTAFITGGTGGIGAVACRLFAAQGAKVVIAGRREAEGRALAEEITAQGHEAIFIATDVTDEASVKASIAQTIDRFGALHVLYNNAGGSSSLDGPVTETPSEVFWQTIKLDLFGTWNCCHHAIPAIIAAGGGSVINTASIMGAMGVAKRDAYSASKGGVISLTRAMAVEYADRKVRVNCIIPGAVATERVKRFFDTEPHLEAQKRAYLLGLAEPEDVVMAAIYLASDESRRTTGQTLGVDSGILIS